MKVPRSGREKKKHISKALREFKRWVQLLFFWERVQLLLCCFLNGKVKTNLILTFWDWFSASLSQIFIWWDWGGLHSNWLLKPVIFWAQVLVIHTFLNFWYCFLLTLVDYCKLGLWCITPPWWTKLRENSTTE